jgi:putative proteasome-type protease
LGLLAETGLVFISDSRTNAGIDDVGTYTKMFSFGVSKERTIVILTSGNLSITQAVLSLVEEDIDNAAPESLHSLPTMYAIARYLGKKNREIMALDKDILSCSNIAYDCRLIVGGQIKGHEPALYLIYAEGNSIRATPETPFLQIGETKYGKTILDRAFRFDTGLDSAARCAIISMDATMRSNLSVGPPIDIAVYYKDSFELRHKRRFPERAPFLIKFRRQWEQELQEVVTRMPMVPWDE